MYRIDTMKRNKVIALSMLIVGTTALASTEIDVLKDRITALETT